MSPAALVDRGGQPIAPMALSYDAIAVDQETVGFARQAAYAAGMVIEEPDRTIYALGTAAKLSLPAGLGEPGAATAASALLAAIPGRAGAAGGALAIGALPFDPQAAGALVIPAAALVADGERLRLVAVGAAGETRADPRLFAGSGITAAPPPDEFDVQSDAAEADYERLVRGAVAAIDAGELDKVVLARALTVRANRPYRQADLLAHLRKLHPSCAVFALNGFLGATPELLVGRAGDTAFSRPLAGTVRRGRDAEEDRRRIGALLGSDKEGREHRLGVAPIVAAFAAVGAAVDADSEPHVVELANVFHLETAVTARFASAAPSALELAAALHPPSAVAGSPTDTALAYLRRHEGLARDRYAGPLGYQEASGDGRFYLGIRSAVVNGTVARLFAGAGIVAGSRPEAELAETNAKFEALLSAFTAA